MSAHPPEDGQPPAAPAARPARYRNPLERFISNSFKIERGHHVDPAGVRGYPVDFGAKAVAPTLLSGFTAEPGRHLWVAHIQRALGSYERWLAGAGEEWLAAAVAAADLLLEHQASGGIHDGGWVQTAEYPHTFVLRPPWVSGMAQGEGASLLVRIHRETGEDRYAEAALRALRPLAVPSTEGGACALLDGRPFPEEYPTQPPSFVLNGAIFALWGVHDVAIGLSDPDAGRSFGEGVDALAASIHRWDTGSWSRYDLFPHRVPNVASAAYHGLHVVQLEAMVGLAPRPELRAAAERFAAYADSRLCHARAFARKALFRVAVPRSRRAADLLPWAS
ncbi:MAG: heparosan-N-sulfate-glucuronate 5-epimerase [Thermoleophilaceae bacterium]|nr:heparosan-N-sulfate-glucuronate 5-epimerase [Thermoleophilaceae bacterium]